MKVRRVTEPLPLNAAAAVFTAEGKVELWLPHAEPGAEATDNVMAATAAAYASTNPALAALLESSLDAAMALHRASK